jgi:RimJ/RimL family protein N-acetyltransferase
MSRDKLTSDRVLTGCRGVLREKRLSDAADDYAWASDAELTRFNAALPLDIPFSEYLGNYEERLHRMWQQGGIFAIETPGGKHIGSCMYYDVDKWRRTVTLGIMIGDRAYWNKGYGTDAITTIVEHLFHTTNVNKILAEILDWNIRGQRCFEKSGFRVSERTVKHGDSFVVMKVERAESLL